MCWRIYFCGSALHLCHMKVITVEPWVAFRPPSSPKWGSREGREARTSPHRARGILHPVCSMLLRGRLRYNDEKRWNMKEDTEIVNKRIWMRSNAALHIFPPFYWLIGRSKTFPFGRRVAFHAPLQSFDIWRQWHTFLRRTERRSTVSPQLIIVWSWQHLPFYQFPNRWRNHWG